MLRIDDGTTLGKFFTLTTGSSEEVEKMKDRLNAANDRSKSTIN